MAARLLTEARRQRDLSRAAETPEVATPACCGPEQAQLQQAASQQPDVEGATGAASSVVHEGAPPLMAPHAAPPEPEHLAKDEQCDPGYDAEDPYRAFTSMATAIGEKAPRRDTVASVGARQSLATRTASRTATAIVEEAAREAVLAMEREELAAIEAERLAIEAMEAMEARADPAGESAAPAPRTGGQREQREQRELVRQPPPPRPPPLTDAQLQGRSEAQLVAERAAAMAMEDRRAAAARAMETGSMEERAAAARSHWSQVKRQVRAGVLSLAEAAPHRPHISAAISLGWFAAEASMELSLTPGEQLWVLEDPDRIATPQGWMMAANAKGGEGLVPESYVRVIPSTEPGHARLHLKAQPRRTGAPSAASALGHVLGTPTSGTACNTNRTRRSRSTNNSRGQEAVHLISTPREERDASIADMVPPTPPRESTSPTSHSVYRPPLEDLLKQAFASEFPPPPELPPPGTPAPAQAVSSPPVLQPLVVVASPPGGQPKMTTRERWVHARRMVQQGAGQLCRRVGSPLPFREREGASQMGTAARGAAAAGQPSPSASHSISRSPIGEDGIDEAGKPLVQGRAGLREPPPPSLARQKSLSRFAASAGAAAAVRVASGGTPEVEGNDSPMHASEPSSSCAV